MLSSRENVTLVNLWYTKRAPCTLILFGGSPEGGGVLDNSRVSIDKAPPAVVEKPGPPEVRRVAPVP